MTSSKQYAPRRAFSSSAQHLRTSGQKHREAAPGYEDLFPDELLPDRFDKRDARRKGLQNKAILMSVVGLALVLILGVSSAFMLASQGSEPFAIQSDAEIVTVEDVPSLS